MEHELSKNMPISAFIIFVGSFIIFLYLLYDDYTKTEADQRPINETVWIYIFFILLIICIIVSGMCVLNSRPEFKINKNIKKIKNSFQSILPMFKGKRII